MKIPPQKSHPISRAFALMTGAIGVFSFAVALTTDFGSKNLFADAKFCSETATNASLASYSDALEVLFPAEKISTDGKFADSCTQLPSAHKNKIAKVRKPRHSPRAVAATGTPSKTETARLTFPANASPAFKALLEDEPKDLLDQTAFEHAFNSIPEERAALELPAAGQIANLALPEVAFAETASDAEIDFTPEAPIAQEIASELVPRQFEDVRAKLAHFNSELKEMRGPELVAPAPLPTPSEMAIQEIAALKVNEEEPSAPKPAPELIKPAPKEEAVAEEKILEDVEASATASRAKEAFTITEAVAATTERADADAPPEEPQEREDFDDEDIPGDKLMGTLSMDESVLDWLTSKKGHIELYLQPSKSRDPVDSIQIDYQYPNDHFEFDMSDVVGKYRLIASIFEPSKRTAVAQVQYHRFIAEETIKEKARFHITAKAFEKALNRASSQRRTPSFIATIFEGASGNYKRPKAIAGAVVSVVGFPEWGTFISNANGEVRLPAVPGNSELLLSVAAEGFFPTYRALPVFQTTSYSPVYLISKDKVETITQLFSGKAQKDNQGLVFGRVFNPTTRRPKEEEVLNVVPQAPGEKPLYFGALPDKKLKETTSTGLFAFLNLVPSFRSLTRLDGKRSYVTHVRPGTAQYIEIGRGGSKRLLGNVVSPFDSVGPVKVRLIGDENSEVETDENGNFEIPDIDLEPGILTLEMEAEGYPKTWQSFGWHPRESDKRMVFHLIPTDIVEESAASLAKVKLLPKQGSIVGGANASFFEKGNSCAFVSLYDMDGKKVENAGPYRFAVKPEAVKVYGDHCLAKKAPGFAFYNLNDGQYSLKWSKADGSVLSSHVVHVGRDRITVTVN